MRTLVISVVVLALLIAGGVVGYRPMSDYWQKRNMPKWRMAEVTEGDIVHVVNSTGTIKPVRQISVGAFVSGPIDAEFELRDLDGNRLFDKEGKPLNLAEFNQKVKQGQVLAQLVRVQKLLIQARNDLNRAKILQTEDKRFIAQAEIDRVAANLGSLEAQEVAALAAIKQAEAAEKLAKTNVEYTTIKAPKAGIIIDRKIEPGQTLAAQFQTPEMFIIAEELPERVFIHATVDEADIGLIKIAKEKELPVKFTVDAYDQLFVGRIAETRLGSTTTQNVVTYPVVVESKNEAIYKRKPVDKAEEASADGEEPPADAAEEKANERTADINLKLLPGMTANLSFEVDKVERVKKIPNGALRFFPQPQHVRQEDKELLEGKIEEQRPESANEVQETGLSATERSEARAKRNLRHVWVVDGYKLKAVEVIVGLSDSRFTELVSGDLKVGDKLVTGIELQQNWGG
jgi:HlyD family secretion protein